MTLKKYNELFLGIFILILSIVYFYAITTITIKIQTPFNSKYVPTLLAGIAFILGVSQCISGYKAAKNYNETEEEPKDMKAVILMFFLIVVYVAVLREIGFLVSTTILLFLQMILLAPKAKRNLLLFAMVSIISTVIIYYSFRIGLQLMLPSGLLG